MSGKRIAIVQSNYIPWKGYFDLLALVDHFVLYDDVQFNKYNWRNRNRIKTREGGRWLTIPIVQKSLQQKIQDVEAADRFWMKKHWRSIEVNYARAAYFSEYKDFFEDLYLSTREKYLSEINYRFLTALCGLLGIGTTLSWSRDYHLPEGRIERVVDLCQQLGANEFLSGPTARPYINEPLFTAGGIRVVWMDYQGYPEYRQLFCPPFIHEVSVIDLLLNEGAKEARRYMLSAKISRPGAPGGQEGQARRS